MSDLISRRAAMNEFAERVKRSNNSDFAPTPTWNDAVEIVENLPSVDLPHWIPCSEGKPELWHKVIVTVKGTDYVTCEDGESIAEAIERTSKIRRVDVGFVGSDGWYGADGYPMMVHPIAWMPLPEPWRGEQDE